jgi:integrase
MAKLKITKRAVDSCPFPEKGQDVYFDTQMIGFGLCVGKKTKTYFAQRQVAERTVRIKIGRHGDVTAEEARSEARDILAELAKGKTRRTGSETTLTLREALEKYLEARTGLRPFTVETYRRVIDSYLGDWSDRPLGEISPRQVMERHAQLGKEKGKPTANTAMRILRAIYNFHSALDENLPPNPVMRLTLTRSWYRETRRQTIVPIPQLSDWYGAVMALSNDAARDYLRLLLFTGMRRSEAQRLRWENIDFKARTLLVPETKNHEPLLLPLSDFVLDLLERRRAKTEDREWVFPGDGKSGHLEEPKKFIHQVRLASGVDFNLHDLRRTFITVAESLDISAYALKRLLNHKSDRDVTAGYIVLSVERLRAPMQKIANHLEEACIGKESFSQVSPGRVA